MNKKRNHRDNNSAEGTPLSFMVVDIENKTNKELKLEVRNKVEKLFNANKQNLLQQLALNDCPANREAYKVLCERYRKECINMLRQFYMQIDMLKPDSRVKIKI